jgi:predicted MFS family arabinose efflux permease
MGEEKENQGLSEKQVLGAITVSHTSQHFFQGAGILNQSMIDNLKLNYTQIGLMTGLLNVLGILPILYSLLSRRISRRVLLGGSNILIGLGCLITGAADRFAVVLGGQSASGIGQAGQHPMSSSIIAEKYQKKGIGSALSVFFGLGYVGNIISPLLLSSVAFLYGYQSAFFVLGIIPICTGIMILVVLRKEPAATVIHIERKDRSLSQDVKASLRVPGAIAILLAYGFVSGGTGLGVLNTWVPLFLRSPKGLGQPILAAGVVSALGTIGGVIGTIYLGRVAEKRGYLKIAMISLTITTLMIVSLSFYTTFSLLIIPNLFLLSLTTFSLTSLMQAHLMSVAGPNEREILTGLFFAVGAGVSALWSTLLGYLIDRYNFNVVWTTMGAAGFIALFLLFYAYRSMKK